MADSGEGDSIDGGDASAEDVAAGDADAPARRGRRPPRGRSPGGSGSSGAGGHDGPMLPQSIPVQIYVSLDGEPSPETLVVQGGHEGRWWTDEEGWAQVALAPAIPGELYVMASHPEARTGGVAYDLLSPTPTLEIGLERYDPTDNVDYLFRDPGEPGSSTTNDKCGHCHIGINEQWFGSAHRSSADNPIVQDVYAASGAQDLEGHGACADCHAPGIDGALGGRDLAEAEGFALDYGVHCDVCHKVESIDLEAAPGVAGRLRIHRPSEPPLSTSMGPELPLYFGPNPDVANLFMGIVQRDHYREATLCAGCHEQEQEVLVPGEAIDLERWPDGRLPVHSTYSEWLAGPMNPGAPCQSCHMPPDPAMMNGANVEQFMESVGVVGGWPRPPGMVRQHIWKGPRGPGDEMLESAAALWIEASVEGEELVAAVTVKNVGPGHALPTGEPMRQLILRVEARCGGGVDAEELVATGGDALPGWAGAIATSDVPSTWLTWPDAAPGMQIRVVQRTGAWHDYSGFGPFGDGTFDAEAKGLPVDEVVGAATVLSVEGDGTVALDSPLPEGDVAYLVDEASHAGAAGFAFARVLVDADGRSMAHHALAVDVASDNRLLPQQAWTSTHRFASLCEEPVVRAELIHRALPLRLARERGWELRDTVMAELER